MKLIKEIEKEIKKELLEETNRKLSREDYTIMLTEGICTNEEDIDDCMKEGKCMELECFKDALKFRKECFVKFCMEKFNKWNKGDEA